ncbi:MAG: ATP-binding protein [Elusimicrobiaceae bacterium]|nr:ATP-binding protein [Elusimicrobiaceae bacterium]
MKKKRLHGLFFNAVLALTLISLVPFVFIGIHLTRVNSRILQHEIFQKQQIVAGRLASVVQSYLTHTSQYFSVFIDLHTDFGGHAFLNKQDLEYLRGKDPAVTYLSALNNEGQEIFSSGNLAATQGYSSLIPAMLNTCVTRQENFLGQVYFVPGRGWFIPLAFPIYDSLEDRHSVSGMLVAELGLAELGRLLAQTYPLEMEAFVAGPDNQVVSYNGAPAGMADTASPDLRQSVRELQQQLGGKPVGEVIASNKRKWLAAVADLALPGWKVYVAQPSNITSKLVFESTLHSVWDVLRILLIMFLFILGVSYWVIVPITRPLERLRKAALLLRESDVIIRRSDVDIPNNEIGDLAEVFVEMAEVLHYRREELLRAQRQLAHANQDLEKRVEERTYALKEASAKLVQKERLAAIGQMASIISHEIRNPLAVITNAARLIKICVQSPEPRVVKQFSIIEEEVKQANNIISEVLGYARTRDLILSVTEVNSYVHDILATYPFASTVKIKENLSAESVRVKIDVEEIKQAIRNLISNAVEAMQQKGTLTVGVQVGRRAVCISIADTGPGISSEIRHKIFSPFFTTKARGTGLGLAVVGKAISRHHGKIYIASKPGEGTCFKIYLRIYRRPGDTSYGTTC